jgi:hypothetical protein
MPIIYTSNSKQFELTLNETYEYIKKDLKVSDNIICKTNEEMILVAKYIQNITKFSVIYGLDNNVVCMMSK